MVVARIGAQTSHLADQIQAADARPDLAVVMVGANDVTHRVRPTTSVRLLDEAVRRLRAAGAAVLVITCPDLGTVEPIPHPLRWVARRASRRLAAAQTVAAVEAGARTVSLGSILGPEFAAAPGQMFSPDRFHPSPAGYAAAAAAILPSAASALDLVPEDDALEAMQRMTTSCRSRWPQWRQPRRAGPKSLPPRLPGMIAVSADAGRCCAIVAAAASGSCAGARRRDGGRSLVLSAGTVVVTSR